MSYSQVWHAAAKLDYQEAYEWYEAKQNELGERFAATVRKLMTEILAHPEIYGHRTKKKYREARVKDFPYSIVYTIYKSEKVIFVSSLHHHKKHAHSKYRKI